MAIPWLEGKTIKNCPKIQGIATPACGLVRNDRSIESAINCNLKILQSGGIVLAFMGKIV